MADSAAIRSLPGRASRAKAAAPLQRKPLRLPTGKLLPWLLPTLVLAGWQAAASFGLVSTRFMPAPLDVAAAGWRLAQTGELWENLWVSFARAAAGFLIGGGIGLSFVLANGLSNLSEGRAWPPRRCRTTGSPAGSATGAECCAPSEAWCR
jgi:sulfonate transport system permease protein